MIQVHKIITAKIETAIEIIDATLLSIEEAMKLLTQKEREYDNWWWLRSPGLDTDDAVYVYNDGEIDDLGYYVELCDACVRPALQIKNLESSNLKVGDIFEVNGYEFKVISDSLAWMHKQDIGEYVFNNDYEKGNNYDTSDVKKFIDEWFEKIRGEKYANK